jgi:hypothetical protein
VSRTAWYLVRRIALDGDTYFGRILHASESDQGDFRNPLLLGQRFVPVTLFATEREAKAESHRLDAASRTGLNPLGLSEDWDTLTSLTPDELAVRLHRKGFARFPVPVENDEYHFVARNKWRDWWDEQSPSWTAEQLADAWAVFDKVRFFDVVEIEVEDEDDPDVPV